MFRIEKKEYWKTRVLENKCIFNVGAHWITGTPRPLLNVYTYGTIRPSFI